MILATLLWLFVAESARTYHGVSIAELGTTRWTHVSVCGIATLVKTEDDGDVHIRLEDGKGAFVVAEIVPYHPLQIPKKGQSVRVAGISRYDRAHSWPEVHPVEALSIVAACLTSPDSGRP